jgi:uncharacterized hydantoinase/oxoprolinase family protein
MICADGPQFTAADAGTMATDIAERQIARVVVAVRQVLGRMSAQPETMIVSGHGVFLARSVLSEILPTAKVVSLVDELGPDISRAATAHALATLSQERHRS